MNDLGAEKQVPYMEDEEVKRWADKFIKDNWRKDYPIDVEEVCDNLGISVIPIIDLKKLLNIDAYTTSDFKTIVIDDDCFNNNLNRCRFSIAHELGHVVLHKEYYPTNIKDVETCLKYSRFFSNKRVEIQANVFAANLLMPRDEFDAQLRKYFGDDILYGLENSSNSERLDAMTCISNYFKVSGRSVGYRISNLYPEILAVLG